jgi:beta-glucosidase
MSVLTPTAQLGWLRDVPWGLRKLLNYLADRYKKPIYMTENVSLVFRCVGLD